MSILTNGLIEHHVADFQDHAAVIARLSPTLPDSTRVRDYWLSTLPESKESRSSWTFIHEGGLSDQCEYLGYYGPGGFCVHFGQRVARITASCRFSGFATIGPMQAVHLTAFKSIARALGGSQVVLMPEEDGPIEDAAMYDGASLEECVALIRKTWGDPHPKTEVVTEDSQIYYSRRSPVWFIEDTR